MRRTLKFIGRTLGRTLVFIGRTLGFIGRPLGRILGFIGKTLEFIDRTLGNASMYDLSLNPLYIRKRE